MDLKTIKELRDRFIPIHNAAEAGEDVKSELLDWCNDFVAKTNSMVHASTAEADDDTSPSIEWLNGPDISPQERERYAKANEHLNVQMCLVCLHLTGDGTNCNCS